MSGHRLPNQLLADTEEKNPNNAQYPLIIRTYDGFNRTVHPDVVYFESSWNGYKYWMVHTPFPFDNDFWENPCIVVSNDGVQWIDAPGVTNPIDEVTEEENNQGIYLSDAILVFANNRLECFYRWYNKNTREEKIYRQYSSDGADWQGKEVVLDKTGTGLGMILSPSIVYENGKYRMWAVDNPNRRVMYTESIDAKNWSTFKEIPLQFKGKTAEPWHLHVFKEHNSLYHLTMSEYKSAGPRSIFHGISDDGNYFSEVKEILKTKEGASWDNGYLYRPSLVKVGGKYKLYYSARAAGGIGAWRIGLVEGDSLGTLRSTENYNADFFFEIARIVSESIRSDTLRAEDISVITDKNGNPRIKLLKRNVSGVSLETGKSNELRVVADNGTDKGDIDVRKIIIDGIELFTAGEELRILKPGGFMDLALRKIRSATFEPLSESAGMTFRGSVLISRLGDTVPSIKLLDTGKYGARLEVTATDTLEVKRDSGHSGGNLKVGSVIFEGSSTNVRGAIRFNLSTNKHQGYDGTTWHDLY